MPDDDIEDDAAELDQDPIPGLGEAPDFADGEAFQDGVVDIPQEAE